MYVNLGNLWGRIPSKANNKLIRVLGEQFNFVILRCYFLIKKGNAATGMSDKCAISRRTLGTLGTDSMSESKCTCLVQIFSDCLFA